MTASAPHVPALRFGRAYASLETSEVRALAGGETLARVSQVNAGLVRRDLRRAGEHAAKLRAVPTERMLAICAEAARHFLEARLPLDDGGLEHGPDEYVAMLSATSGLPYVLVRKNMEKIATVLREMPAILRGLTRGLDRAVLDAGLGDAGGVRVSFLPATDALGVVLPSNSPAVNSLWLPAVALRTPVVLKPGREEPWTPLRIVRALEAAGCPREAFGFYPTDHEGAAAILSTCGRSLLFGDESTTSQWAADPRIEVHGPGRSKVLFGPDEAERWEEHLDVLVESVAANGGRSCINASTIVTPSRADEIADALARRLSELVPRAPDDPSATLSAFANPKLAAFVDAAIEAGLAAGGAQDVTGRHRVGARATEQGGRQYLLPTVVRCDSIEHPLARTEYLFPFTSVVEVPADALARSLGPSLVVTAITRDEALVAELLAAPHVDRLNLGPVPTIHVEWDQPHEGNLFELLYERRAIQRAQGW